MKKFVRSIFLCFFVLPICAMKKEVAKKEKKDIACVAINIGLNEGVEAENIPFLLQLVAIEKFWSDSHCLTKERLVCPFYRSKFLDQEVTPFAMLCSLPKKVQKNKVQSDDALKVALYKNNFYKSSFLKSHSVCCPPVYAGCSRCALIFYFLKKGGMVTDILCELEPHLPKIRFPEIGKIIRQYILLIDKEVQALQNNEAPEGVSLCGKIESYHELIDQYCNVHVVHQCNRDSAMVPTNLWEDHKKYRIEDFLKLKAGLKTLHEKIRPRYHLGYEFKKRRSLADCNIACVK